MSDCERKNKDCGDENDKRHLWSDHETWILIRIWDQYIFQLKSQFRNLDICKKMGQDLLDQYAIKRSPKQIQTKIITLTRKYRRLSEAATSGSQQNSAHIWPFYWEVQRILRKCETSDEEEESEKEWENPPLTVHLQESKNCVNLRASPTEKIMNVNINGNENSISKVSSSIELSDQSSLDIPAGDSEVLDFKSIANNVPCNRGQKRKLDDILEDLVQVQREQARGTKEFQRESALLLREQLTLQRENLMAQMRLVSVLERLLAKEDSRT